MGSLFALGGALGGTEHNAWASAFAAVGGYYARETGLSGSGLLGVARSLGITKVLPGSAYSIAGLEAGVEKALPYLGILAGTTEAAASFEDIGSRISEAHGNLLAVNRHAVAGDGLRGLSGSAVSLAGLGAIGAVSVVSAPEVVTGLLLLSVVLSVADAAEGGA